MTSGEHGTPTGFKGPLEEQSFPTRLLAQVVKPGERPELHGYSVQHDLARYYGLSELWLLCLTGELPTPATARAFTVACWFLAPVSVADASVHAAVLSRLCGAPSTATLATAALALSEQARFEVQGVDELITHLETGSGDFPKDYRAHTPEQRAALQRLMLALQSNDAHFPELACTPTLEAALYVLLYRCGLTRREQLEAALVFARLPVATAEAFKARRCDFSGYPTNLPQYVYEP